MSPRRGTYQGAGSGALLERLSNDWLYQIEACRDYDPGPRLERIRAPLLALNWADDPINPPELAILEREIQRVAHGRAILMPSGTGTRGHDSCMMAALWKPCLLQLLEGAVHR